LAVELELRGEGSTVDVVCQISRAETLEIESEVKRWKGKGSVDCL